MVSIHRYRRCGGGSIPPSSTTHDQQHPPSAHPSNHGGLISSQANDYSSTRLRSGHIACHPRQAPRRNFGGIHVRCRICDIDCPHGRCRTSRSESPQRDRPPSRHGCGSAAVHPIHAILIGHVALKKPQDGHPHKLRTTSDRHRLSA